MQSENKQEMLNFEPSRNLKDGIRFAWNLPPNWENEPCSICAVKTAIALSMWFPWDPEVDDVRLFKMPEGINIKSDGYVTLKDMNSLVRKNFVVKKRLTFKRGERPTLKDFIRDNPHKTAIVCCLGHYLYLQEGTYYSFFNNDNDDVVSVWLLGPHIMGA